MEIQTNGPGIYLVFILTAKGIKTKEELKRAWEAWGRYMARIHAKPMNILTNNEDDNDSKK